MQGVVEEALATVLRREAILTVAGRTDRGVHALGQVASHPGAPAGLRSLNGLLPDDVAALASEAAPDGFDARRDARSRTYRYRLLLRAVASPFERGRALWWPRGVDEAQLRASAAALRGTHDFTAFTPTETDHVFFERTLLRCEWVRESAAVLALWVEANAFMHNMARILVGTMLEVAGGRRTLDGFRRLLAGGTRAEAGPTAPPHGLYLASVRY